MTALLEVKGLTKRFGPLTAVDNISFSVERGEVLGFLGPNGAGKSTTMKMITGFLLPTEGSAAVAGFDVVGKPIEVKKRIGYLPEGAPLYGDMTPKALLHFIADVRGLSKVDRKRRIDEAIEKVHIAEVFYQPIETLSKGYKRRVGLAQAILHDPDLLILDEPTDGLDPNQKHEVRQLLRQMAPGKAIVISTHILEEVDAVCSRAMIIARGKVLVDGTPETLRAHRAASTSVSFRIASGLIDRFLPRLRAHGAVARVETISHAKGLASLLVVSRADQDVAAAVTALAAAENVLVQEMRAEARRLDDVFRSLTIGE
ncbi:MAG: ABC transporter ATP-binding protein [Alphaproteobacteria bacterium]|nr:ABC transporter ATP-binding protein [Alphaproteobacteria bacterium]